MQSQVSSLITRVKTAVISFHGFTLVACCIRTHSGDRFTCVSRSRRCARAVCGVRTEGTVEAQLIRLGVVLDAAHAVVVVRISTELAIRRPCTVTRLLAVVVATVRGGRDG